MNYHHSIDPSLYRTVNWTGKFFHSISFPRVKYPRIAEQFLAVNQRFKCIPEIHPLFLETVKINKFHNNFLNVCLYFCISEDVVNADINLKLGCT